MTTAPGVETDPYADSAARRGGDLPQGRKPTSYGTGPPNLYPHLGFDPAPGDADSVRGLHKKLASCAEVLEETHGLVTRLMDGSCWTGDAAVAFREELRGGPLALNLRNAAHSLRKAAGQLVCWEGELDDFQRRAGRLDADARDAREVLDRVKGHASQARSTPALTHANAAVAHAQADLDAILGRARKLAAEHEEKARHRAAKIHAATKKLAPQEPGFFEKSLNWLTDNLPDILSWTAAVVGIVALFVISGGTAAAVLLMGAAALSAGAFATRLTRPEVWASLKDGFTKGELDADFWSNLIGVTADGLGALPGIGAVGRGTHAALHGAGESGEALSLGQKLATFGTETMTAGRDLTDLRNPLTEWVINKAPRLTRTVEATEAVAPWAGLGTASYGLSASLADSLDNDTAAKIGTFLDGAFLGPIDGAETVELVRRAFQ
ncbi:hypothetical protein [Streptomyces shenzhenensis]|uniref:WXG100 family type VII secretion target n=1 Tax=Streptomyces shenzhenensis TaxID=943815 RepID=A0A3M0HYW7_9ACTN|nr:hypothetical protein [Streptomyces shenzhenensis]RMB81180.1 hypothetical protein CTZ28_35950 [Streptomyces shenzhenensis]